ncbi:MAG: hypothetical protein HYZ27_08175 [Deltaproteobacteria bacterium]|nr:hypothetical protein [Deltaproteobacteria bacterium]
MAREDLVERVQVLMASGGPVSFYDSLVVARAARRLRELSDQDMAALLALHDHADTTDGGREILSDLLRSCAQRLTQERERAARPLTLDDHDATVRATAGTTLRLALPERRGQGCRWGLAHTRGPITCAPAGGDSGVALFTVILNAPGRAEILLTEDTPAQGGPTPRRFCLRVIVE